MTRTRKKIFVWSAVIANALIALSAFVEIGGYILKTMRSESTSGALSEWTIIGLLAMGGYTGAVYYMTRKNPTQNPEYTPEELLK